MLYRAVEVNRVFGFQLEFFAPDFQSQGSLHHKQKLHPRMLVRFRPLRRHFLKFGQKGIQLGVVRPGVEALKVVENILRPGRSGERTRSFLRTMPTTRPFRSS